MVPRSFGSRTRNGAFGDARLATKEAGEEIVRCAVDRTVEFAGDFLIRGTPANALCRKPQKDKALYFPNGSGACAQHPLPPPQQAPR
jgi:hypothetical protein